MGYTRIMDDKPSELREFTIFFLQLALGSIVMALFFGTLVQILIP